MPDKIITLEPHLLEKTIDVLRKASALAKEEKCIVEILHDDGKFIVTAESDANDIYAQHLKEQTILHKTTVPNFFLSNPNKS